MMIHRSSLHFQDAFVFGQDQVELANNKITLLLVGVQKMNLSSTCR